MIHRGSLTIRTLRTPRLQIIGEEIVLGGAVQTLGGVVGWCGAIGTVDTCSVVLSVTDSVQKVTGGAVKALSGGPGTLRTLETALDVGIENEVGQTAVHTLGGVCKAGPETILTADKAAQSVEAGLTLETD